MKWQDTTKTKKAMDMSFHCLRDRECQKNLEYIGDQENKTTQTTGLSTIKKHTTKTKDGCESDQRNNETNTTTVGLHHNTRGRHNNIQHQQHETCSPQRCKLP